jgi:alpha,alpha-trehalose phosphorylase
VAGFGGMRDHDGVLMFAPRLPPGLTRLAFTIRHLGRRLRVETDGDTVTYALTDHADSLDVVHHGERLTVEAGAPVRRPVPPALQVPQVRQPAGREPHLGPPRRA